MISKEKYDLVGGFNEDLSIEYNDIDFCLKLKEKGFDNIYLPQVTLYHYESISRGHPHRTKESYNKHIKEVGIFKSKWQKYIDHDPCYSPHLSLLFSDFRINTF
jgi:GT2 family glycosyltransferase